MCQVEVFKEQLLKVCNCSMCNYLMCNCSRSNYSRCNYSMHKYSRYKCSRSNHSMCNHACTIIRGAIVFSLLNQQATSYQQAAAVEWKFYLFKCKCSRCNHSRCKYSRCNLKVQLCFCFSTSQPAENKQPTSRCCSEVKSKTFQNFSPTRIYSNTRIKLT